jgi:hypothetical protein
LLSPPSLDLLLPYSLGSPRQRQNLSAAKVQGIMVDLNLTTQQFASAISILFVRSVGST